MLPRRCYRLKCDYESWRKLPHAFSGQTAIKEIKFMGTKRQLALTTAIQLLQCSHKLVRHPKQASTCSTTTACCGTRNNPTVQYICFKMKTPQSIMGRYITRQKLTVIATKAVIMVEHLTLRTVVLTLPQVPSVEIIEEKSILTFWIRCWVAFFSRVLQACIISH